jgi:hypothetical protein
MLYVHKNYKQIVKPNYKVVMQNPAEKLLASGAGRWRVACQLLCGYFSLAAASINPDRQALLKLFAVDDEGSHVRARIRRSGSPWAESLPMVSLTRGPAK